MAAYYDGLEFKTKLEARWAAFFDLAGWEWRYNPCEIGDWRPDFRVNFKCGHSECDGSHTLLVAVLPFSSLESFKDHPCFEQVWGVKDSHGKWRADGGAAFGNNPSVTRWEIIHGAGGGAENADFRINNPHELWALTQGLVSP